MKKIRLGNTKLFTLIDADDFDRVIKLKWFAAKIGNKYYVRTNYNIEFKSLHQFIMNGKGIDHINRNPLDNRKSNLRFCTQSQNNANKAPRSDNSCGYKGVHMRNDGRKKKWRVTVTHKEKHIYGGSYHSIVDAALAYDELAKKIYGEFAYLNFP